MKIKGICLFKLCMCYYYWLLFQWNRLLGTSNPTS